MCVKESRWAHACVKDRDCVKGDRDRKENGVQSHHAMIRGPYPGRRAAGRGRARMPIQARAGGRARMPVAPSKGGLLRPMPVGPCTLQQKAAAICPLGKAHHRTALHLARKGGGRGGIPQGNPSDTAKPTTHTAHADGQGDPYWLRYPGPVTSTRGLRFTHTHLHLIPANKCLVLSLAFGALTVELLLYCYPPS